MEPVNGAINGKGYKARGKFWSYGFHKGVDKIAPEGTPVVATRSGKVIHAGWGGTAGKYAGIHVVIDYDKFPDGKPGLYGHYWHLSSENVKIGQRVKAGQKIGTVGKTGNVTGAHLHYEIQKLSRWGALRSVDPKRWIEAQA